MENFAKTIRYNALFNIYSDLLSPRQKDILEQYYGYNLSISEIADDNNISRAAVEDAIQKGIKKLDEFEEKLGILTCNEKMKSLLDEYDSSNEDKKLEIINELKKIVNRF